MLVSIDLEHARKEVYTAAYNEFQKLEEDGFDADATYSAVDEACDETIAPFIRDYLEDPHRETVQVRTGKINGSYSIDTEIFYQLMDKHVALTFGDVFDPNKERRHTIEDGREVNRR